MLIDRKKNSNWLNTTRERRYNILQYSLLSDRIQSTVNLMMRAKSINKTMYSFIGNCMIINHSSKYGRNVIDPSMEVEVYKILQEWESNNILHIQEMHRSTISQKEKENGVIHQSTVSSSQQVINLIMRTKRMNKTK
jgi:hypothetical protein